LLKKASSFVLGRLSPCNVLEDGTGGKATIRSHVIEASGSSEAWYVPPRVFRSLRPRREPFEQPQKTVL
jgi:hypothetical protein